VIVIGIIGAIGTGKTEVLCLLRERGARGVAADELSREVLAPGLPALQQVREAFGDEFFDAEGQLRRREMGELIFRDEAARRRLDDIMHPLMTEALRRRLAAWEAEGVEVAVVEAAVLVEMGARPLVDRLILVTAPEEVRIQRLREHVGLTEAEARRRVAAHQRLGLEAGPADLIIVNDSSLEKLRQLVEQAWAEVVHC
jgi:dephospho-CoA kinase